MSTSDVVIYGPNYNIPTLPAAQYFEWRNANGDLGDNLPLPEGIPYWNDGTVKGAECLVGQTDTDLFVIAEDRNFGLGLFHYVYENEERTGWRYSYTLPQRKLTNERRTVIMPGTMNDVAAKLGGGLGSLQFGGNPQEMMNPGDGAHYAGANGPANKESIAAVAKKLGYVAGYVMGSAPAVTMAMTKTNKKGEPDSYSIIAKESKPSRPIAVLLALPSRCVMRGGSMAMPSEIKNGTVDFNSIGDQEMIYQTFSLNAAIAYISALGGQLPEYQPTVNGAGKQWSADEIVYNHPNVSYVCVHATKKSNTASNAKKKRTEIPGPYRFHLKTTSPRRSLFTQYNHVCLRALRHISINCKTEEDAKTVNEAAFASWQYRHIAGKEQTTMLEEAINNCPSTIWEKEYNINGEQVKSIGSAYFMVGAAENHVAPDGKAVPIAHQQLKYVPWYVTGKDRNNAAVPVTQIVMRKETVSKSQVDGAPKNVRWTTDPIVYKEETKNDPLFRPYASFLTMAKDMGFLREDTLIKMSGRSRRSAARSYELDSEQADALSKWIDNAAVISEIDDVRAEARNRANVEGRL